MKKPIKFIITSILSITTLFLGCTKDKITITVLGENSSNLQAIEALKGDYEKNNNIKLDFKAYTFEESFNKANMDFANKTGLYDIVLQYNFSLSTFIRNKYVYTIDELSENLPEDILSFEADIFPNAWKEVGYYYKNPSNPSEGIVKVGYPFASNTMLLVYNKEFFYNEKYKTDYKKRYKEELVPPNTWEQYKRIAEFFTQKDQSTGKFNYGVCMHGAVGGWLYYEWCGYLYGMGGKIMGKERGWEGNENTEITVYSDISIKATNHMLSLKPYNAGNFITTDGNEQIKLMKNGNVAMALMWSDYIYYLIYNKDGEIDGKFGVVPVPGDKSMLAGGAFFINKQSKHPQEAFKYILCLLQKENQIKLMKRGLCSCLKTAYDDIEVQKIPYSHALKVSLERGVYMAEAGPDADMINNKITAYIQKIWNNELSVENGLSKAQEEIEKERKEIFLNLK